MSPPPPPDEYARRRRALALRASLGIPEGDSGGGSVVVVAGLIKGSSHDDDIVPWTKAALVELLASSDGHVHLFLMGAG